MGKHIERMRAWIDSFAADVEALEKVVAADKAPRDARVQCAAALNYLVTRMDLIPDWEETCGILDDAMVLRVSVAMAADKGLDGLDGATTATTGRMANEVDAVSDFLGPELYPKFKKYCQDLVGKEVRGRKPHGIVDDAAQRAALFKEIDEEMGRLPPAPMKDPDGVERTVLGYFKSKL